MIDTTNKQISVGFNLCKEELLDLDIGDVKTYEVHYNDTYSVVNRVKISGCKIENILIKFQMANLMRIDGITDKNDVIKELYHDIDDFNGHLIESGNISKKLNKYIGKNFLRKLHLNNGINKNFRYKTKESSIYFETYILIYDEDVVQIDFTFYDEIFNYFKIVSSPTVSIDNPSEK